MDESKYFIKDGYVENLPAQETSSEAEQFWDDVRAASAAHYQYYVYKYALNLACRDNLCRIIDVGCGIGTKLRLIKEKLPNAELTGIDLPGAIYHCKNTYKWGHWIPDDFENPTADYSGISADLIICADVLEHLKNPDSLLSILSNIRASRYVILSTPERDLYRGEECMTCPHPYHVREWNFEELEKYLTSRGFTIIDHFLQFPVRVFPSKPCFREIVLRLIRNKPLKYNQVFLLRGP